MTPALQGLYKLEFVRRACSGKNIGSFSGIGKFVRSHFIQLGTCEGVVGIQPQLISDGTSVTGLSPVIILTRMPAWLQVLLPNLLSLKTTVSSRIFVYSLITSITAIWEGPNFYQRTISHAPQGSLS